MTEEQLKAWLASAGFRTASNQLASHFNECRWYAYRRSALPARECEGNEGKPAQIVVTPYYFTINGHRSESVTVEVCGQYGEWWKLQAYGIKPADLPVALSGIEASLIAAWNALDVVPATSQAICS